MLAALKSPWSPLCVGIWQAPHYRTLRTLTTSTFPAQAQPLLFHPLQYPTTHFSERKAGQEEGQGAGDDPEIMATVQKPDYGLCTCCLPAQQYYRAGTGPAHVPNSSLNFYILPGLKLIWVQNLNPGPVLTHPIIEGRKGSEGQKEQWVRGQGDGLGTSPSTLPPDSAVGAHQSPSGRCPCHHMTLRHAVPPG